MSKGGVGFEIEGVSDLLNILEDAGPRHARNLMRATIHGVAGRITKKAKNNAPKDSGTLRKAIFTKRRKSPPNKPVSEVRVNSGSDAKHDAFYWRFVEYGTIKGQKESRFIGRAADEVRNNFDKILKDEFGQKLEKALAREARRNSRS